MGGSFLLTIRFLLLFILSASFILAQQSAEPKSKPSETGGQSSAAPVAEQHGDAPSDTATVLKVTTRLVVVDVVALDHKGLPVADLKAEDFVLQEDGKEQKVRIFNFQNFQQPAPGGTQTPDPLVPVSLPSNRATNMPRFKANAALNVLLLDGINVTNANQKYTREQMLKFLEKLPAGKPLAVYALGSKLRLLQDFTADPTLLREAVRKSKENSLGVRSESSNAADLPPGLLEQMPDAMLQSILRFGQDQVMNQMDERVTLTLAQMGALARNLSGYPGRKNLIWISEAFPDYVFPSNANNSGRNSGMSSSLLPIAKTYQTQIDHTADLLSNAQVAVYPVDAGTLANHDAYSSLSNTDSNGNYLGRSARGETREGMGSQQANEISQANESTSNSHSTMNSVADQTGGKAFYNTNNIEKAIRESMDDGSTYYTLGYYPENKNWDGRFRKIAVKVNRPGVKLHYRQGFFAVEPKDYVRQDPKLQAIDIGNALNIENPISTTLAFQASVAPPSATDSKVQIHFGINPRAISFELSEDGLQHAAVDCSVRAYNQKGETVRTQGSTFSAALPPEQYQKVLKMIFPCSQTLDLPPGQYALRLAVRDDSNGLIGTANAVVRVPANEARQEARPGEKKP